MIVKHSGIYKIRNLKNGKVYIGQSIDTNRRFRQHKNSINKNIICSLYRAINKYGIENFEFVVLEYITDKEKLTEKEQFWLDYYQSYNPEFGYNICKEAESMRGFNCTEETKRKIALANKGRKCKPFTEEHRKHLSEAMKGKNRKPKSEEFKIKVSNKLKGRVFSKEHKEKLSSNHSKSKNWLGKKHSEESKDKMSVSAKIIWQNRKINKENK